MTSCKNITPKKRIICSGDLRDIVIVQVRVLSPKKFDDPDYNETFTETKTLRASVQTTRGFQSFKDVGITTQIQNNITHKIYVRFSTSYTITSENWLDFKSERYIIRDVENIDERSEWLLLYCIKKGSDAKLANSA